jgi:hypothetical protein
MKTASSPAQGVAASSNVVALADFTPMRNKPMALDYLPRQLAITSPGSNSRVSPTANRTCASTS